MIKNVMFLKKCFLVAGHI